ncbi:MAG: histidine phosphatase family protein [Ignavibacteria bacterium]|nr:histidine phosphatase family protein [Ignavibacteria bacterium]
MKIGLIRHFKVNLKYPKKLLLSYNEVFEWYVKYGTADVVVKKIDLSGGDWNKCYASPLLRSEITAKSVYKGEITVLDDLKELDVLPVLKGTSPKPFLLWGLMLKIKSTKKNHITHEFEKKLSAFLDKMLSENNCDVLVISHGFVMTFLQKKLRENGFKGNGFFIPDYNKVYIYKN